ncbi:MAG: electron transfer flavoprotein-ubiquinone oxidoreductase [Steroidobacteraceae bacterium]|nr:electron transfer flavoprotein-ubiquinone oxidoreductase [Nevskiaceae bacterium]MCP5360489.1 electron transfer flavoprotein-ubiquinone oxidoreductase [Nevskiaceae bacterium]MCP5467559.1 electron transfer flavoprotein-ubiquinone oxidoreductase [Nevskiaceae bacterium]MCP5472835.1 electron transfer flavoprotein-ubiquinone oxidoreductase [Nevskiaceae bacterium]
MNDAVERDQMEYDVVIVGAGPAGLACAIRLKELKPELNICILEKASAIGAHMFSGAVLEPGPLDELLPGWRNSPPAICVPAKRDEFALLTRSGRHRLPTPPQQHNAGNFIISLGLLAPQLAAKAESLGVDVFAGFAASRPLLENGRVVGVQIGDMGLEKNGEPGPNYAPGPEVRAPLTVLAEGCRGSVSKVLIREFALDAHCDPQTYGLGFKELWQLPPGRVEPGLIQHTVGWPLDNGTYGGSFIYHLGNDRLYLGYVVGLDYRDPRLRPFEAFQQFKHHPSIRPLLEGGEIVAAGARTIAAGGWQSMPRLEMPGALLIGDAGGTLNVPKIKGIHQTLRSGMLAAQQIAETGSSEGFDARWRSSPGGQELRKVRNIKPGFHRGLWFGIANAAFETMTGGRAPWTLKNHAAYAEMQKLDEYISPERHWVPRDLPPRDRLASVFFANNSHDESQPAHLKVLDPSICVDRCTQEYGNPCQNFCPANVYEMVDDGAGGRRLQINAANCVHCKACDIKDPYQIITWTTPEGGSGPIYQSL